MPWPGRLASESFAGASVHFPHCGHTASNAPDLHYTYELKATSRSTYGLTVSGCGCSVSHPSTDRNKRRLTLKDCRDVVEWSHYDCKWLSTYQLDKDNTCPSKYGLTVSGCGFTVPHPSTVHAWSRRGFGGGRSAAFPYLSLRLPVRLRCFAGVCVRILLPVGCCLGSRLESHNRVRVLVEVVLLRFLPFIKGWRE